MSPSKHILFARENFNTMYPEMCPLLEEHYHEIAWNIEKIPLDVDVEKYSFLQEEGILLCYSLRDQGKLVGYAAFLKQYHLHYKSTLFAANDVLFIKEPYRKAGIGSSFLNFCEEDLKCLGCQVIALRIKKCLDWTPLAQHLGFESIETTHLKWTGN